MLLHAHQTVSKRETGIRSNGIRSNRQIGIKSNGIRSKGIRSNVLNVSQYDILPFKKSKMNDQNQLPLEIHQDQ